jgi:lipoprotein signal peptidase
MLQYAVLCACIHSNKTMPYLKNVNSRSHFSENTSYRNYGVTWTPEENSAQLRFCLAIVSIILLIWSIIKPHLAHEFPLCHIKVGVQHKCKEGNESCVLWSYN